MATRTSQNDDQGPIGVFDSGLGGLTVVRELRAALPHRDIVYLGDSARVPYGIKSLETVRRFAMEDAAFLLRFRPELIVVACNTASAAAIDQVRRTSAAQVVDVISPGAAAAVSETDGMIGVIGTEATIASGAYGRAIRTRDPNREVISVACPLLVPIVEEGRSQDDPIVLHVLCDYLRDMQRRRPGAVILGCTHYPLLSGAIAKLMGPDVPLVSSAKAAALEVASRLCENRDGRAGTSSKTGRLFCYTTGSADRFATLAERFGGGAIASVSHVGTDELQGESELELP